MEKKVLVSYFSATGRTAGLAKTIARLTGGEIFEIKPVNPYTAKDLDWTNEESRSCREMKDPECRPKILDKVKDFDSYGIVFIGFPIWWYQAPRIIETFIQDYDFSGKILIPFVTSGGSGVGKSDDILKSLCKGNPKWLSGRRMEPDESTESIKKWLEGLSIEV